MNLLRSITTRQVDAYHNDLNGVEGWGYKISVTGWMVDAWMMDRRMAARWMDGWMVGLMDG